MSAVAEQLRQARQAQGLTVHQVADHTKIRTDHIEALDEGNYDVFSAQVYVRGFVRNYARLLKLDEAQILTQLDAELSHTKKFAAPPPLSNRPHTIVDRLTLLLSKINWQKSLIWFVVIAILGIGGVIYLGWRHYNTSDPLAGLTPGIYQAQKTGGETLPLPATGRKP